MIFWIIILLKYFFFELSARSLQNGNLIDRGCNCRGYFYVGRLFIPIRFLRNLCILSTSNHDPLCDIKGKPLAPWSSTCKTAAYRVILNSDALLWTQSMTFVCAALLFFANSVCSPWGWYGPCCLWVSYWEVLWQEFSHAKRMLSKRQLVR